jgi:hypothetical protein
MSVRFPTSLALCPEVDVSRRISTLLVTRVFDSVCIPVAMLAGPHDVSLTAMHVCTYVFKSVSGWMATRPGAHVSRSGIRHRDTHCLFPPCTSLYRRVGCGVAVWLVSVVMTRMTMRLELRLVMRLRSHVNRGVTHPHVTGMARRFARRLVPTLCTCVCRCGGMRLIRRIASRF